MLLDIIKEEYVQLDIQVEDWEDAIKKSAQPLVNDLKITEEYVDKIINISKEIGPYIVITKHVALPHAPIEFGALQPAMGITRLQKPVVSGNESNDPVKYLFCMSAENSNMHLEVMSELVELLSDDDFYHILSTATDSKEILRFIKNKL